MRAVARVRHQNMVFTSRPVALLPSLNAVSASVQVFDVSEDASQLSVGTHHVTIALSASALTCSEYMQLTNPSDKAIKGSERDYDVLAVPPGQYDLTFSYKLPLDGKTQNIVKEITLPTEDLTVFWEGAPGKLEGLGEPEGRLVNAQGTSVQYFHQNGLKPGEKIAFRITGVEIDRSDTQTWLVLAVVFGAVLLVVIFRLRRPAAPPSDR